MFAAVVLRLPTPTADCSMSRKKPIKFEEALDELETLVEELEEGELSLEESLKAFEKGIRLTRDCQQALSDAEQKVRLLIEENDELQEQDFPDLQDSD